LNNLYIEDKIIVLILLIKEEILMKKVKDQLKTIAKSLLSLSKKVEKIAKQADALRPVKPAPAAKKTVAKKTVAKKTVAKKTVAKKTAAKKAVAKKTPAKKAALPKQLTVLDAVFDSIKRTKKGVTVAKLKEKLDLNAKQLSNALYKLSKQGKIEAKSRGLYFKK
jgi:predicted Rossmann fold nucleotide-binding protein DprA/Smf involved in DNA uptake